jgi:hypothetical protein
MIQINNNKTTIIIKVKIMETMVRMVMLMMMRMKK